MLKLVASFFLLQHMPKTRALSKHQQDKGSEDDIDAAFEVKKDLNSLSREEQMAVVER